LTVVRGETAYFDVSEVEVTNSFALRLTSGNISTVPGTTNNSTTAGRNRTSTDTLIVYEVPLDSPTQIIYQDVTELSIGGVIDVVDKIGPTGATGDTGPAGVPSITTYTPTFAGTGLVFTGSPASGIYTKYGQSVTVNISVAMTNVSNFGNGQYSLTLPVLPLASSRFEFSGVLQRSSSIYNIIGYTSTTGSATLNLFYLGTDNIGQSLTGTAPVTLTTDDVIIINGSYISAT